MRRISNEQTTSMCNDGYLKIALSNVVRQLHLEKNRREIDSMRYKGVIENVDKSIQKYVLRFVDRW